MFKMNSHYIIILLINLLCLNVISAQQLAEDGRSENASFETRFVEATILYHNEKWDDAIKLFESLLTEERRNDAVTYELSRTWYKKGKIAQSYEYIERATSLAPNNIWYQLFKVKLLEEDARYKEAAEQYDVLINLDPQAFEFYKQKATNLARSGKYAEAARALELYELNFGTSEEILQRKYDLLMAANMPDEAAEEIKNMLEIQPDNTHYLYLLASYMAKKGKTENADSLLNRILQIDPSDARAGIALSKKNKTNGLSIPYLKSLQKIFGDPSADLDTKIIELIPYLEKVNPRDTALIEVLLENIEILQKTHPKEAKVYTIAGDLHKLRLYYQSAIFAYKEAIRLDKTNFAVYDELMYLYYLKGDFKALYSTAQEALDYYPNQIKIYLWSALALSYTGKYDKAIKELDQALMMSSGNKAMEARILAYKSFTYLLEGQVDKAWNAYSQLQKIAPNNEELHAFCLFHLSNNKAFHQKLPDAFSDAEKNNNQSSIIKVMKMRFNAMNTPETIDEKQLSLTKNYAIDPLELEAIGDIYYMKGQIELAVSIWQNAIGIGGSVYRNYLKINKGEINAH
jgi:tetratricopeptide (TPR) repeat protein